MPSYTKEKLSASGVNNSPIPIVALASPGTLVHTHPGGQIIDNIVLYLNNPTGSNIDASIEFGSTISPIKVRVRRNGTTILAIEKIPLTGGTVSVFATLNGLVAYGYVDRISWKYFFNS